MKITFRLPLYFASLSSLYSILFTLFFLLFLSTVSGQSYPKRIPPEGLSPASIGFETFRIGYKKDTIEFYVYRNSDQPISTMVLYTGGSSPNPIIRYSIKPDSSVQYYRKINFDVRKFPAGWAYVIVSKPGIPFSTPYGTPPDLPKYDRLNSLDYWVGMHSAVINYLKKKVFRHIRQVVAFGHSEGAYVVPRLALLNKSVTHIVCWGGGYLSDFYDFAILNRQEAIKGAISQELAQQKIDTLFERYKKIYSTPTSTKKDDGYTLKRWASYGKPVLYDLIQLEIPIYVVAGGKDNSSPIESSYAVVLEFIRLGKTNLTYKAYPNSDHGLEESTADGKIIDHADEPWLALFHWVGR